MAPLIAVKIDKTRSFDLTNRIIYFPELLIPVRSYAQLYFDQRLRAAFFLQLKRMSSAAPFRAGPLVDTDKLPNTVFMFNISMLLLNNHT
jgi:hypothetical protein